MYLVTLLFLFFIVGVETRFELRVPAKDLFWQAAKWFSFDFLYLSDINGLKGTISILSTLWTLRYEWLFYVSLPVLGFVYAMIGPKGGWVLCVGAFFLSFLGGQWIPVAYFATGSIIVHILKSEAKVLRLQQLWSVVGLACLVLLGLFFHDAHGPTQALLMGPVFIAALQAQGIWSLLVRPSMRFLGHISYSFYLLHNPFVHILATWIVGPTLFANLSPYGMYGSLFFMAPVVIAASTLTFLWIEKPFLHAPLKRRGDKADKTYGVS